MPPSGCRRPYDPAAVSRLLEQSRVDTVVAHALPRKQLTDWRDRYPATTLVNLQPLSALNIEAEVKEGLSRLRIVPHRAPLSIAEVDWLIPTEVSLSSGTDGWL
jgi:hypothetical protein